MSIVPTQCVSLKLPVCLSEKQLQIQTADLCQSRTLQNVSLALYCFVLFTFGLGNRFPSAAIITICRHLHFVLHEHSDDPRVCRLLWSLCVVFLLYAFLLFVFVFGNIKLFLSLVFVSNLDP